MGQVTDPNLLKQLGTPPPAPAGGGYDRVMTGPDPFKVSGERRAEAGDRRADAALAIQQQNAILQRQLQEQQLANQQITAQQKAEKRATQQQAASEAVNQLRIVTKAARRAQALSQKGAGGWAGTLGFMPESDARSLNNALTPIKANTAFDALQKMRAASPTGGALGSVSERELDLLQNTSSSTALDNLGKPEDLQSGLQDVIDNYERVLFKLPAGERDFKKRALEMISRGADLPTVQRFFEEHGKTFTPDNERWVRTGMQSRMRKVQGAAGAPVRAAPKLQPGTEADRYMQQYGVRR